MCHTRIGWCRRGAAQLPAPIARLPCHRPLQAQDYQERHMDAADIYLGLQRSDDPEVAARTQFLYRLSD